MKARWFYVFVVLVGIGWWIMQAYAPSVEAVPLDVVVLASVNSAGDQGNDSSDQLSLSDDGQTVAFTSDASNLVGDDPYHSDIFIHDFASGNTERISVTPSGGSAESDSFDPLISGNGRVVAFQSYALDLTPQYKTGLFVRNRDTGITKIISLSPSGETPNVYARLADINTNGRYVTFMSSATNLVPGTITHLDRIYLRDVTNNTLEIVSLTPDGTSATEDSSGGFLSGDGRYVLFSTEAALVADDTNETMDAYIRDRTLGETFRVSLASGEEIAEGAIGGGLSNDGTYIFVTTSAALTENDTDITEDVYRLRRDGSEVILISSSEAFEGPALHIFNSTDGRYALYSHSPSDSPNAGLIRYDVETGEAFDIRRDAYGNFRDVVISGFGAEAQGLSGDGHTTAFSSADGSLVPHDANNASDVFVAFEGALPAPTPTPTITPSPTATPLPLSLYLPVLVRQTTLSPIPQYTRITNGANGNSTRPVVSADSSVVVFMSEATNLVEDDTNGVSDIFAWERATETITRLSLMENGTEATGASYRPALTSDGRYVLFASDSALTATDTNTVSDLYRLDRDTGELLLVSTDANGVPGNGNSVHGALSGDGTIVAFTSQARNFGVTPNTPAGDSLLYIKDLTTGQITIPLTSNDEDGTALRQVAYPAISEDGNVVSVAAYSDSDIYCGGQNIYKYVRDTNTLLLFAVSVSTIRYATLYNRPALSPDSTHLAYEKYIYTQGGPGESAIVTTEGTIYSRAPFTAPKSCAYDPGDAPEVQYSADGHYVVFVAPDLEGYTPNIPGDTNNWLDLFRQDLVSGRTERITRTGSPGEQPNGDTFDPAVNANGDTIVVASQATNLGNIPDANGDTIDIYVIDIR